MEPKTYFIETASLEPQSEPTLIGNGIEEAYRRLNKRAHDAKMVIVGIMVHTMQDHYIISAQAIHAERIRMQEQHGWIQQFLKG